MTATPNPVPVDPLQQAACRLESIGNVPPAEYEQAYYRQREAVAWGTGVDATKVNAHTPFLPAWLAAVGKNATDQLRPKYGQFYGFEAATPRNADMVAMAMFSYK